MSFVLHVPYVLYKKKGRKMYAHKWQLVSEINAGDSGMARRNSGAASLIELRAR